jgi:hypothetical protein
MSELGLDGTTGVRVGIPVLPGITMPLPQLPGVIVAPVSGPPGTEGPPGPPGDSGENPVVDWFYGHGPPDGTIVGAGLGDMYQDIDSGLLYQLR